MVQIYNKLEILSVPKIESTLDLPSWVPDWTVSDSAAPLRPWGDDTGAYFHFSATGSFTYSATISADLSQLIIEGELVDQIADIGDWERVARAYSKSPYITGESALDAYWQTIVASYFPHGKFIDGAYFYIWRKDTVIVRFLAQLGLLRLGWISEILLLGYFLLKGLLNLIKYWRTLGIQPVSKFPEGMAPAVHRRVIRTRGGYIGLAPKLAAVGDSLVLAKGGMLPLLLRKNNELWQFIGDCYVHGMMSGERFDATKCQ
ncbi:hypothetical protein N431DRAFT_469070 [Stipitochalara longipes BDJ]|nr:hypothetical protein N431DRAFT_469070 [Stipitochalara longipes BDJ]